MCVCVCVCGLMDGWMEGGREEGWMKGGREGGRDGWMDAVRICLAYNLPSMVSSFYGGNKNTIIYGILISAH